MKSLRSLLSMIAVVAIGVGAMQSAKAGGLIADFADRVIPGSGPALDSWSSQWQQRDSDASVFSQVLKGRPDDVPFRSARGAGPAQGQMFFGPPPPPPEEQLGGQDGGGYYPPPRVYPAPVYYQAPPPPVYYQVPPAPAYYQPIMYGPPVVGPRPIYRRY